MNIALKPEKAALIAILISVLLFSFKLAVGLYINSVGVIADAIHSSMDVAAAAVTYVALRIAKQPPDQDHCFGHGQYEALAAVVQSLLILFVSGVIIREAVSALVNGHFVEQTGPGIAVTLLSAIIQGVVVLYLLRIAKQTGSIALRANAYHQAADVITSAGILISLLIIRFTGYGFLDSVAAMLVALIIARSALYLGKEGLSQLLDKCPTDYKPEQVRSIIVELSNVILDVHQIRVRQSGRDIHIDAHVVVPNEVRIVEVNELLKKAKSEMQKHYPGCTVVMQFEPVAQHQEID